MERLVIRCSSVVTVETSSPVTSIHPGTQKNVGSMERALAWGCLLACLWALSWIMPMKSLLSFDRIGIYEYGTKYL